MAAAAAAKATAGSAPTLAKAEDLLRLQSEVNQMKERMDFLSSMVPQVNVCQDYFQKVECEASVQLLRLKKAQVKPELPKGMTEDDVSNTSLETTKWLHILTDAVIAFFHESLANQAKESGHSRSPRTSQGSNVTQIDISPRHGGVNAAQVPSDTRGYITGGLSPRRINLAPVAEVPAPSADGGDSGFGGGAFAATLAGPGPGAYTQQRRPGATPQASPTAPAIEPPSIVLRTASRNNSGPFVAGTSPSAQIVEPRSQIVEPRWQAAPVSAAVGGGGGGFLLPKPSGPNAEIARATRPSGTPPITQIEPQPGSSVVTRSTVVVAPPNAITPTTINRTPPVQIAQHQYAADRDEPLVEPGTGGTSAGGHGHFRVGEGAPYTSPQYDTLQIMTTEGPGGLALGKGSWAKAYRQAQGQRRDALQLLCTSGIVTARELGDDNTVISEEHIDECVFIATEMLQTWPMDMWARQGADAKKFFEARLTAIYQRKFGEHQP